MNSLKQRTILALSQVVINLPWKLLGLLLKSQPIEDSFLEQFLMGITGQKLNCLNRGLIIL